MKDTSGILFYMPDPDRGPLMVVTPALFDPPAVFAAVTQEEQTLEQRLTMEWLFRQCDATTRRTGYLTKYTRVINFDGMSLAKMDRRLNKRMAASARMMEESYPQLLGAA